MNNVVTQRFVKCHHKLKEINKIKSSRQFALSLDYLPQSLSEILKGRRDVTIELLRKTIKKYQFNPVYLFTGEGAMFMLEDNKRSFRVLTVAMNKNNEESIIHVPVPALAGYAGDVSDPSFISDLPTFSLPDYKYKVGIHRSFDVTGDSMEPTLFEGDKVVCSFIDPAVWESTLKDHFVYVIVTRGDVLTKRIVNTIKTNNELVLHSDNGFYDPYVMNISDIREVWYVRVKVSPFLPSPQNINNMMRDDIKEIKKAISEQTESLVKLKDQLGIFEEND